MLSLCRRFNVNVQAPPTENPPPPPAADQEIQPPPEEEQDRITQRPSNPSHGGPEGRAP